MHLFFTPDLTDLTYRLNEDESKHCVRVLRLTEGDTLYLVNGQGAFCQAEIIDAHPKACLLKIIRREEKYEERPFRIHMAVAPTKNIDRFEWFLEKATEMGIDEVTPLLCRFSERKEVKPERLEKVMVAAMKQSLKAYLPVLHPLQQFKSLIANPFDGQKFIAHCYPGQKPLLRDQIQKGGNCLILIGPEGDFSEEEVVMALNQGFTPISLGTSRLRTETAALAACHTVNLINQ